MRHERSGNVWYEHYAKVKEKGGCLIKIFCEETINITKKINVQGGE